MITAIAVLIGLLGVLLLLILASRINQVDKHLQLKKHRAKDAGLADLLNYAAVVEDGVIVCKNGSLMASWIYEGEDNASATDEHRNDVSTRINRALAGLGNGWMVHVDAIRRSVPAYSPRSASHFPDPVTAAIDEERRQLFESLGTLYEGAFVLTLTYFPPSIAQTKFIEMMFDDDGEKLNAQGRVKSVIEQFQRACNNVEGNLSTVLGMERMCSHELQMEGGEVIRQDDQLRFLQFCVTGKNHPVVLPKNPMYMDAVIGGEELYSGVVPKVGRNFIQCVSIEGFPLESYPGMLTMLSELPIDYRWSTRFIFMDQHEALSSLEKYRKKWRQKVRPFMDQVFNTNSGAIDEDALAMMEDASQAMAEVNSGHIAMGYYTSVVVLMGADRAEVEANARRVEKAINHLGFAARVETINTMDACLGSLPGHGVENVRRPLVNTMNLADLIPTSTVWTGAMTAPCPMYPPGSPPLMHCITSGNSPFRLNCHVRDLGHMMMFGPTRAGKSTHLGILAAQLRRYKDMSLFAFDKGGSMMPVCKAAGGDHYDIGSDGGQLAFCPLQYLGTKADRAWAMEWIDTLLALNGVITTPAQRNEIGETIVNMHDTGAKTMTEFCGSIQDRAITDALTQYTVEGMMGHLLDAEEDALDLSSFTVFEIEELMGMGEKFALPVLLYLFRRIEVALKGQPAAIILDEAWLMLAHPAFRDKIREWLKAFAKKNCIVIMATQNLTDAEKSGILDVIVESTASKIFLPNIYARDEDTAALYRRMGLNNRQIDIIASATPKRQYYFVSEQGRRLYELALGPLSLAFVGATDKESLAEINALERKHGDDWIHYWLDQRNLSLKAYQGEAA